MKAEHRKELATNALADRMGRLLEGVKQKPQRGTVFWIILGVAAAVVVFLAVRWYSVGKVENSEGWYAYYVSMFNGDDKAVLESHAEQMQGKAVRFDQNWAGMWTAIKKIGVDPKGAKELLTIVKRRYEQLKEECEGDPVLVPEAMYALAIIEETLAIEDRKHLDTAIDYYDEVAKKHPNSAYGQLAAKRLETLNSSEGRREVSQIYQDLQTLTRMDRPPPLERPNLLDPKK